jgi:hypothetical protein
MVEYEFSRLQIRDDLKGKDVDKVKSLFMYILALIVLLAPAILLGWIGWSLLDWWGGILGVVGGLVIFGFSINKIAQQEEELEEQDGVVAEASTPSPEAVGKE